MISTRTMGVALATTALVVAACGEPSVVPEEPGEPGVDQPQPEDAPEDLEDEEGARGDDEQLRIAERHSLELAAEEHGVAVTEVRIIEAERVTWPDGSLGCAEPDEAYAQALAEGYRIVLQVQDREVHYHGIEGEPPFHCEDPQSPAD